MGPAFVQDHETAETRMYRAFLELNSRIFYTAAAEHRQAYRETAEALREQLIALIQRIPVPTEADVQQHNTAQLVGHFAPRTVS